MGDVMASTLIHINSGNGHGPLENASKGPKNNILDYCSARIQFRNCYKGQGQFWTFASEQLVGVIFCLISSFQLDVANNYYFQEKLDLFTHK